MPFGPLEPRNCENPECGKRFVPHTPWQRHCEEKCKMRCVYLRVVLPKRIKKYEKRLEVLTRNPKKAGYARRLTASLAACRLKMGSFKAALAGK